ncbi:unnamed protein product, partial [marine sediment metagenome]
MITSQSLSEYKNLSLALAIGHGRSLELTEITERAFNFDLI